MSKKKYHHMSLEGRTEWSLRPRWSGMRWLIRYGVGGVNDPIVWSRDCDVDEDLGEYDWPADMRAAFERLSGKSEFSPAERTAVNLVEMVAGNDPGGGFNQACRFGYLVAGHAVYCHNDGWLYAPRKCRRTWYTGGEQRDEDCPGYIARAALGSAGAGA